MKKSDTIVAEVHAIRAVINERLKGLTDSEITAYYLESGRQLAEQYGFKIYKNTEEAERARPF